jgi:Transposase, Mutator family
VYTLVPLLPSSGLKSHTAMVSPSVPPGSVAVAVPAIAARSSATPSATSRWKPGFGAAGAGCREHCQARPPRQAPPWHVAYRDRKRVAADLKPVYRAVNAEPAWEALEAFDQTWGERYPMIADSWRARWDHITPFLALPAELRRAVYTTNSIENLNRQIRKTIKTRGHFPAEQAATKLIYLAIQRAETKWRTAYNWTTTLRGLKIHFAETDCPTDMNPVASASDTERRTPPIRIAAVSAPHPCSANGLGRCAGTSSPSSALSRSIWRLRLRRRAIWSRATLTRASAGSLRSLAFRARRARPRWAGRDEHERRRNL